MMLETQALHLTPTRCRVALLLLGASLMLGISQPAAAEGPEATIEAASDQLLATLRETPVEKLTDPGSLRERVMPVLSGYADFDRMSRLVLGKHWRQATPAQRAEFTQQFRLLMVRFYAASLSALLETTSPKSIAIDVLPTRPDADADRVMVRTRVRIGETQPFPVTYHLYRRGNQWKVYDMALEGVSIVANYRASFAGEIRISGLDALIRRLTERNAQA